MNKILEAYKESINESNDVWTIPTTGSDKDYFETLIQFNSISDPGERKRALNALKEIKSQYKKLLQKDRDSVVDQVGTGKKFPSIWQFMLDITNDYRRIDVVVPNEIKKIVKSTLLKRYPDSLFLKEI